MWVRGLKQEVRHLNTKNRLVAPYVGAWIETKAIRLRECECSSHPMWVRGLKLRLLVNLCMILCVAPYVGAWIETTSALIASRLSDVAPYVGAWIETE